MVCWYSYGDFTPRFRYTSPSRLMEYMQRAGPPEAVSHLDSQSPSFSIFLSVQYNIPGFIVSNPSATVRFRSS
jgi:hypothetical protein